MDENEESNSEKSEKDNNEKVPEESVEDVRDPATLDRSDCIQLYRDLLTQKQFLTTKNNILHRRLAEYYKKRKLEYVLKPMDGSTDLEDKYKQKLFSYEEIKEKGSKEMSEVTGKLKRIESHYLQKSKETSKLMHELIQLEKNTGTGLIYSEKGKPISEKTIIRLIKLQQAKNNETQNLLLRYIRARNAVTHLDEHVQRLENIGPGNTVAQYEQLFIENNNLNDKIEEREDELIKNRMKCTEHNQILAHIKEKMHHMEEVIESTECDLGDAEIEIFQTREDLGAVKSRRDRLRMMVGSERLKAGLLTRRDLLTDFEASIGQISNLQKRKISLENRISKTAYHLRKIRQKQFGPQREFSYF